MKIQCRKSYLLLGIAPVLLLASTNSMAKMYKWYDSDGKAHYSDHIPPEATNKAHSRLNKNAITIQETGTAKTKEQIEKEQELARLRKEQERVIKQQQAKDNVLLNTFRSEDDLILARDGKLRSVDNIITITKGNIKRLKAKLAEMQKNAAELEKTGEAVSPKFLKDIDSNKRQIGEAYASIVRREAIKEEIRQKFNKDLKRFRILKKTHGHNTATQISTISKKLNTVYLCKNTSDCDKAWKLAKKYTRQHSTTKIQLIGENILMTEAPREQADISITVSRIRDKEKSTEKIFLDLQCKSTSTGDRLCKSSKVINIKKGFIPFLKTQDQ